MRCLHIFTKEGKKEKIIINVRFLVFYSKFTATVIYFVTLCLADFVLRFYDVSY